MLRTKAEGSFTIEAALIMPVILGVIVMFLYAAMFCHDRCVIEYVTHIACQRAAYEEERVIETANEYIQENLPQMLILDWDTTVNTVNRDDSIDVEVRAQTPVFGSGCIHRATVHKHFYPKY